MIHPIFQAIFTAHFGEQTKSDETKSSEYDICWFCDGSGDWHGENCRVCEGAGMIDYSKDEEVK